MLGEIITAVALTATQKTAATFGAKVATSLVSTITASAINNSLNQSKSQELATAIAKKDTEAVEKIKKQMMMRSAVISAIIAGGGAVAFNAANVQIQESDII